MKSKLSSAVYVFMGMDKTDARTQTLAQLQGRRKQVVRLHNNGHKVMNIVEMTGAYLPDGT